MSRRGETREKLVTIADTLFYENGYANTSFSDVAKESGIPKGNFYYHFKSKDDLLKAVIDHRLDIIRNLLEDCEKQYNNSRDRLKRIIDILKNETDNVLKYGCPMGSLNVELGKHRDILQNQAAIMFTKFIQWCQAEFKGLDYDDQEAKYNAMHLISTLQGAALLANVYNDDTFIKRETLELKKWIDSI